MESLQGMRIFLQVVQAGSLSAAGRATGQSPASVSRKISMLEESVGAKLLNRTSRSLSLTAIGSVYYDKARQIVDQIDALKTSISEQQSVPRGLLTVHTHASIASRFLSEALPAFLLRYPEITLKLVLTEDSPDKAAEKADVAVCIGAPEDQDLMIRRLSQGVERIVYASPAYLANHPDIMAPQDLAQHNCLTIRVPGGEEDHAVWHYRTATGMKELKVKGNLVSNDVSVLHAAVVTGIGVGLMPAWVLAEDLGFGRVRRILPQYEMTQTVSDHGLYAVFKRPDLLMPKVRVFIDFLVETFRRFEPEIARMAMDARRQSAETERRAPDALRWIHPRGTVR